MQNGISKSVSSTARPTTKVPFVRNGVTYESTLTGHIRTASEVERQMLFQKKVVKREIQFDRVSYQN